LAAELIDLNIFPVSIFFIVLPLYFTFVIAYGLAIYFSIVPLSRLYFFESALIVMP
jgi:hypothetical protein